MTEPISRWTAVHTIGRGVEEAPALRSGFGVTFALAIVGAGGRVVIPILVQQAIDRGFQPDRIRVGVVALLAAIGACVIVLATFCQRQAVARLGRRTEEALYTLRVRLFEHIHRLSIADHNEERKGALVARVTSDVETLAQFFQWGALAWLLDGTLMFTVAGVMLAYDWLLALVAFVVAAPLGLVLGKMQPRLSRAYDDARGHNAEVLTKISEVVSGAETLRVYDAGPHYADVAEEASHRRSNSFIRAGTLGAFLFPSGEVFSVLTVSAVVIVGLLRGPASGLTSGALVGFVLLTYKFLEPIAEFTEVLDQTQTAVAGLRRVIGVLEIPIGPPEPSHPVALPAGALALTIDHVHFTYRSRDGDPDEPPVLHDVTVHIPAGQQVAVIGETGSGKTTLGRLVARLADPTSGAVLLGGTSLTHVANAELRNRLVVVPQEPFLFEGTIAANLGFAKPKLSYGDLERAITDLDLDDWLETM
ncbi:MAG: putative transporter permease/ATP-binding protein, partial [Ilumatobacteraceae bacterium]|nr:putative transporter permease/ATP-binding protein [Ilumatobacteraceae bacterium]